MYVAVRRTHFMAFSSVFFVVPSPPWIPFSDTIEHTGRRYEYFSSYSYGMFLLLLLVFLINFSWCLTRLVDDSSDALTHKRIHGIYIYVLSICNHVQVYMFKLASACWHVCVQLCVRVSVVSFCFQLIRGVLASFTSTFRFYISSVFDNFQCA